MCYVFYVSATRILMIFITQKSEETKRPVRVIRGENEDSPWAPAKGWDSILTRSRLMICLILTAILGFDMTGSMLWTKLTWLKAKVNIRFVGMSLRRVNFIRYLSKCIFDDWNLTYTSVCLTSHRSRKGGKGSGIYVLLCFQYPASRRAVALDLSK